MTHRVLHLIQSLNSVFMKFPSEEYVIFLENYLDDIVLEIKQKASQRLAKENLEQLKLNQQKKDKRVRHDYQVNDLVMLKIEEKNKLDPSWKGIFEIKDVNWANVTLRQIGKRKLQTVHSNRIKPYFSSLQNENSKVDSAK